MTAAKAEAFLSDTLAQNRDSGDLVERMETQHEGRKPGQAIEDDVASALVGLPGQTESSARAEAVLWHERILQRARDRGMDPDALWAEERPGFLGPRTLPSAGDVDSMLAALHSDQTAAVSAQQVQAVRAVLDARGITPEQASRDDVLKAMKGQKDGVLGQPVNADVDPDRLVRVVDITGMFDAARDKKSLMRMLKPLVGERLDTADQGRIARILPKKVDHIAFSVLRPERKPIRTIVGASINSIVDLLEHAVLIESAPNRKITDKSDIERYHRFYVPVWDGRTVRTIRIVAEQSKNGIRVDPGAFDIYEVIQEVPEGAAHGLRTPQGRSDPLVASSPREIRIRQMLAGVKDMKEKEYFLPDDPGRLRSRSVLSAEDVDSMLAALRSDQTATVSAQQVQAVRAVLDARGINPERASRDDVLKAMEDGSGAALGQPVNAGVDPGRMVKVVDLAALLGAKRKPSDLIAKLTTIVNQPLDTADAGRIVRVLPENVKHITYSGAPVFEKDLPARNKSIFNLPMLLEHAALIESGPNTKADKKPDVIDYHRFYVPVSDQGKIKVVRIVAHRTKDGLKIDPGSFDAYDVVLESKKGGPHTSGFPYGSPSTASQGGHPLSISIRQMLSGVKDMKGDSYFQPGDEQIRGSYDPVADVIRLFDQADLSTVLHEGGHRWLFEMIGDQSDSRVLPGAKSRIVRDLQTAMDWLGAEIDVATASPEALREALTVEMHEKWARGVEAYLMEGKAPSAALQQVFERFSAWLFSIYRSLSGLNVELTPEVRGVFDRLLAAEGNEAVQTAKPPQRSKNKN